MEKQNKLKFNIVDVIVLLVLLAGVIFVAMRFLGPLLSSDHDPASDPSAGSFDPDDPEGREATYIVTYFIPESPDYAVAHLQVGSQLTNDAISLDLGTLVDFETGPAQFNSTASNGHMVISDLEGYSSIFVMGRVRGIDNDFGVIVDGLQLAIGHSMVFRAKEVKLWGYVYDIQKLEDTPYVNSKVPDANYFNSAEDDE